MILACSASLSDVESRCKITCTLDDDDDDDDDDDETGRLFILSW